MRESRIKVILGCSLALILAVSFGATRASADTLIDFESQPAGPQTFSAAGPAQTLTIGGVQFMGGVILTDATNNIDTTTVYGTASTGNGGDASLTNPISMIFPSNLGVISMYVFNGLADESGDSYTLSGADSVSCLVSDLSSCVGDTAVIPSNVNDGYALFTFTTDAANDPVTISSSGTNWDFLIDDISFATPAAPPAGPAEPEPTVPEPGTFALLGTGLVGIVVLSWRRGVQTSEMAG